ncbi:MULTISPECIES: SCO2523 family variant P-loop protein [unclassified Streptomyces]|uniref:SCO2523 family variant P-loop protein n=1 Tax=unclassified Streptomyces TaxID=2593676 RepID=UPI0033ACB733
MLVFAASDKGGTGRSVTSANLAYRAALDGADVCFLDFDFGSPTATAVFDLPATDLDVHGTGLHSCLQGRIGAPHRIDVWTRTEHPDLRDRPSGSGRLVLLPGDRSGGEFVTGDEQLHRCVDLVQRLKREFETIVVDLSAGRSYAMDLVLAATAPGGGLDRLKHRWLVFHRWTHQHVRAAAELTFGERGIVRAGEALGHSREELRGSIRFVRAAVPDLASPPWDQVTPARYAWMRQCDQGLEELAAGLGIGGRRVLASIPLEPVLQWQERLITDADVFGRGIADNETRLSLDELARRLYDDSHWGEP